ncbi:MAG: molybdopterin-dependent oxidoreductase [Halobacteriales archaeon]
MRFTPRPRVVDAGVLFATLAAAATGVASLVSGRPGDWWVVAAHGVAGAVLAVLLGWKLRRVAPRLVRPAAWSGAVVVSAGTLALAVATLATGVLWVHGRPLGVGPWTGLTVHAFLGVALLAVLAGHLRSRFRLPARADFEGRRTAMQTAALVGGGVLAWRLQQVVVNVLDGAGAARRFTGSRPVDGDAGNDFPVTSWVADDPAPVDLDRWRLEVSGAVAEPLSLSATDLGAADAEHAVLDCTSGWYADREWAGVRVGRLLDRAGIGDEARFVRFRSVTGYRFSLPLAEAREALLATQVDGEPLSHGHGAPARLVAPGRRGFQWVKWVESVEVLTRPDYGQWVAIFTSGFAGRG